MINITNNSFYTIIQRVFQGWLDVFRHFYDCKGRTSRFSFWSFAILNSLILFLLFVADEYLYLVYRIHIGNMYYDCHLLMLLYFIIGIIPSFCLCIRRLHDIGFTGWWVVGLLMTYIFFPFLYIHFFCELLFLVVASFPSQEQNRFGMKPVHNFTT